MSAKSFIDFKRRIFIETGAGWGSGIELALKAGFEQIYSIELSKLLWNSCSAKFKDILNVRIIFGDSVRILPDLLKEINEPITLWLDAHCSGGDTVGGALPPLLEELEIIKQHPVKNHIILIDDLHSWGWNDILTRKLLEINPEYQINIIDGLHTDQDIMVAQ